MAYVPTQEDLSYMGGKKLVNNSAPSSMSQYIDGPNLNMLGNLKAATTQSQQDQSYMGGSRLIPNTSGMPALAPSSTDTSMASKLKAQQTVQQQQQNNAGTTNNTTTNTGTTPTDPYKQKYEDLVTKSEADKKAAQDQYNADKAARDEQYNQILSAKRAVVRAAIQKAQGSVS